MAHGKTPWAFGKVTDGGKMIGFNLSYEEEVPAFYKAWKRRQRKLLTVNFAKQTHKNSLN